jgi:hypothetical protein
MQNCNVSLVLYGCETWFLTVREEHRLGLFENRVLGSKNNKVTRGWGKLHSEEPYNLFSSPDIVRMIKAMRMRWAEQVACMGKITDLYQILVVKPEGRRPLRRLRNIGG